MQTQTQPQTQTQTRTQTQTQTQTQHTNDETRVNRGQISNNNNLSRACPLQTNTIEPRPNLIIPC